MTYSIDWTAYEAPPRDKKRDPFADMGVAMPFAQMPSGKLQDYIGGQFDLFAAYLPRRGVGLDSEVKAYINKKLKVMEANGRYYISTIDYVIHEMSKQAMIDRENSLIGGLT